MLDLRRTLQSEYLSLCENLSGQSAALELHHRQPSEYGTIRCLDVHHLHHLHGLLSAAPKTEEAAQIFHEVFGHLLMHTIEGGIARAELINALFTAPLPQYHPYFNYDNESDLIAAWKKKFGNPPPITPEEYLDAAKLPIIEAVPSAPSVPNI
jgi:hypothetical protein